MWRDVVLTGQVAEGFALCITLADAFVALCGRDGLWSLMRDIYNEEDEFLREAKLFSQYSFTPLTPVGVTGLHDLEKAVAAILQRLYAFQGQHSPQTPVTQKHIPKSRRNQQIIERYERGDSLQEIAAQFGVSHQRVHQIIQRWSKQGGA